MSDLSRAIEFQFQFANPRLLKVESQIKNPISMFETGDSN